MNSFIRWKLFLMIHVVIGGGYGGGYGGGDYGGYGGRGGGGGGYGGGGRWTASSLSDSFLIIISHHECFQAMTTAEVEEVATEAGLTMIVSFPDGRKFDSQELSSP